MRLMLLCESRVMTAISACVLPCSARSLIRSLTAGVATGALGEGVGGWGIGTSGGKGRGRSPGSSGRKRHQLGGLTPAHTLRRKHMGRPCPGSRDQPDAVTRSPWRVTRTGGRRVKVDRGGAEPERLWLSRSSPSRRASAAAGEKRRTFPLIGQIIVDDLPCLSKQLDGLAGPLY